MSEASINDIPEWIERRILLSLDFHSLLDARTTCKRWNEIIKHTIGRNAILNIRVDRSNAEKRFRRGKWNDSLIAPYVEIRVIPKPVNAYIYGKAISNSPSSLKHFNDVVKFTLFENGSFLHFIHRYMAFLPSVKYVQIRELQYEDSTESKYCTIRSAYTRVIAHTKTWNLALDTIRKLETVRIRLYERIAMLLYMNLFTIRSCSLANLELDFSKTYGLPFSRGQVSEICTTMTNMMEYCYSTLKQFRLKWAIRVETELDYARSDDDVEPFLEFLLTLRNPIWLRLRLQQLLLSFPTINFGIHLCESTIMPFLKSQEPTLKKAVLGRAVPNAGMEEFVRMFPAPKLHKFEFMFYVADVEITAQPVTVVRGAEVLLTETLSLDFSRIARINGGRQGWKHYMHLKLINAPGNTTFLKPELCRLTEYFQNVRTLELINNVDASKAYMEFTNADFHIILRRLKKLVSLKMSSATLLTDAGLLRIPEDAIKKMRETGAYYFANYQGSSVTLAKELKYLDIRDLTSNVTDISVFFGFQHIAKLEKISFHGSHSITSWGKQLLESKFKKNPFFQVHFKAEDDENLLFGNYSLPCIDFP